MEWFTSDQHFGHTNVLKYCARPFKSIEEMNEGLIERHNALVKPGEVVLHLGDFSLSKKYVELILPRLNGAHHLITGNHDQCHPMHCKSEIKLHNVRKYYLDHGFASIRETDLIHIAGHAVTLHHMPYTGDHNGQEERFTKWRPKNHGGWLLHGHIHENYKVRGRCINVGVDVWDYGPVSMAQIEQIIVGRTLEKLRSIHDVRTACEEDDGGS